MLHSALDLPGRPSASASLSWILDLAEFPIALTCVHRPTCSEVKFAESSSEFAEGSQMWQYLSMPPQYDACAGPQPDAELVS